MQAVHDIAPEVSVYHACFALDVSRATFYRNQRNTVECAEPKTTHPPPPRTLSKAERNNVIDKLNSPKFVDKSPAEVYATLLDEGEYFCSTRTMYRILTENKQVKERRNQLRHPEYTKPELIATAPNQVWSWDITKLKGKQTWTYHYLYVIIDIFSRYAVGWMVAEKENAFYATQLIEETARRQAIQPNQLKIHSDRGSPMKAQLMGQLLASLGITRSFSRPYVSDDNPYSEALFKTLKYYPVFPKRFGGHEDAKDFCRTFFRWYNNEHKHSGIGSMTPASVHHGRADEIWNKRKNILTIAFEKYPERFVKGKPLPPKLPREVWINKPITQFEKEDKNQNNNTQENMDEIKTEFEITETKTEIENKKRKEKDTPESNDFCIKIMEPQRKENQKNKTKITP